MIVFFRNQTENAAAFLLDRYVVTCLFPTAPSHELKGREDQRTFQSLTPVQFQLLDLRLSC